MFRIERNDVFGLIHPSIDVHTLGILSFSQILEECGIRTCIADEAPGKDLEALARGEGGSTLRTWLVNRRISTLGFSYRLDPNDAVRLFSVLYNFLKKEKLCIADGGRIRALFFAGLPSACEAVGSRYPDLAGLFKGDETAHETLRIMGVPEDMWPTQVSESIKYDTSRFAFGKEIVRKGDFLSVKPVDRSGYPKYGQKGDRLVERVAHGIERKLPPLMRVHAGPYLPDRREAVALFQDWAAQLAKGGYLDVLSIGTSQLSQSNFGENWDGRINGGGVPIATEEEYASVWKAARPMLVRSYAGTKDVPGLARMYEKTIDIAWHALSFWWFCKLDGRGPNDVLTNLIEHFETMKYIASTNKPLEANVPHHFAFRGSDDLGYVVSGYVAAKSAKKNGIRSFVLQIMFNTPKFTWGVQDLAKARVLLRLVRSLEGPDFKVYLQPRGGLDYFSPEAEKAKAQLAAVTAMMDDIEANDQTSPQIIHVVSYSEAFELADPSVMEESIKITRHALLEYRRQKHQGLMEDMMSNQDLALREEMLYQEARELIAAAERLIPDTYSSHGLYSMMSSGMFALPWLTSCKEEFSAAQIPTKILNGGMKALGPDGGVLSLASRIGTMETNLARRTRYGGHDVGTL